MVSIGVKSWGIYRRVPETHIVKAGVIYESRGEVDREIPSEIALSFIYDWRSRLEVEHGIRTNYISVVGRKVVIQWSVPGASPIGVKAIIIAIIAVCGMVAAKYLVEAIALSIHETGELASILGPENVSLILSMLSLLMLFMMFSPMISMMIGIFRPVIRERR